MPIAGTKNASNLVVGAGGKVSVNYTFNVMPTNFSTALAATWKELGYVTEDGVQFDDSVDRKLVRAWNARRPIRTIPGNAETTFAFSVLQVDAATVPLAFAGGAITTIGPPTEFKYIPNIDVIDFRALCIEWADGTKGYRLLIPKGMVSSSVSIKLTQLDETPIPITFSAMPDTGVDAYQIFTNDPSWSSS
jgi:hypothetical protein